MLTYQHMYAAQKRHAAYYLARLQEISAHYHRGGANMPAALQKAKHLWGQIQMGQAWSARNLDLDASAAICLAFTDESTTRFLAVFQPLSERVRWLSDGLAAAQEMGNHAEIVRLLIELVEVRIFHGEMMLDTNRALLDEALALARRHHLYEGEAHALLTLGRMQILCPPDDGRAREYMQAALDIFRRIDHLPGIADSLRNLGVLEENLQNLELAKTYQQEALSLYTALADDRSRVIVLGRLASIAEREGDYATGYAFAEHALAIARRTEDKRAIANALQVMGLLTDLLGNRAASWDYFEEMLHISRTIDNRRYTMYALVNLGYMASMRGEYSQALAYYTEILAISVQMNDPSRQADALDNIGFLYIELGDLDKARQHLHDALVICREIDAKDLLYTILLHFAYWLARTGQMPLSIQVFQLAVSMPSHNDPLFAEPGAYITGKLQTLMAETVLPRSTTTPGTVDFQQTIQQLLELSATKLADGYSSP